MNTILKVGKKEFAGFFSSPIAYIFIAAFLTVNLFVFFWVETFFARNIADVRPLFEWMPVLLILLVAAITMRLWSEERRAGTLEFLLTMPVNSIQLVLGKFFACLGLVCVALLLTLPLPVTVSFFGPLDWGPVFGGYLATLFLAAAYIAIGLFVSARSSNQIISLIVTALICGFIYSLGSNSLTGLFGNQMSEFLKLVGSGSRFDSITRGVIDLRDLYYYLSLVGVFLMLNVFALEWLRWQGNGSNTHHRLWGAVTGLFVVNFLAANLWLSPVNFARADLTQGNIYSISDATRSYLAQLREPLLIRGYFSAKTHPLLSPLVPRLRDLMKEYAAAGEGRVRVEFVDPQSDPELEHEANEKYSIRPVPFQFASKYQSSVVNSYFNILVQYGDQYEVLGFRDLIEVKSQGETDLDVELRNPEYDLTQSLKKVLYSYQGSGTLFDNISHPINFKGYISPDEKLPEVLVSLKQDLNQILSDLSNAAGGKLTTQLFDPDAQGGELARELEENFGFRPMATSLFDSEGFWFYMMLEGNGQIVQIGLPDNLKKAELEQSVKAAVKRFSKGFLKTVAMHTATSPRSQFGMRGGGSRFSLLSETLAEEHNIITDDLSSGQVNAQADLLLLASPKNLDEMQLFAVDQFLMRGGTVVVSTSPYDIQTRGELSAQTHQSGLNEWLKHHGISLEENLVLDPQSSAFPIPVNRNIGGFVVRETQLVDYPYFTDIRQAGIDQESGMAAGIDQITLTWPSPVILDETLNEHRNVIQLLHSSDHAWLSDRLDIQPDYAAYGQLGFPQGTEVGSQLLGVAVEGRFDSYFKGKPSPLIAASEEDSGVNAKSVDLEKKSETDDEQEQPVVTRMIERSPESARIVLFASNSFLSDEMLGLASSAMGTHYQKPIQLIENVIDWSLEDRGLLSIRGRAQFSRTLDPMDRETQVFWEYLNYGMALLGLFIVWVAHKQVKRAAGSRYAVLLNGMKMA